MVPASRSWHPLRNSLLVGCLVLLACGPVVGPSHAQPPKKPPTGKATSKQQFPFVPGQFGNPEQFMERLFGKSTAEEEQLLAEIKISTEEEREFGRMWVQAYLSELKRQRINVLQKGKDVDYVTSLVTTILPQLTQAERYPKIKIYVVDSPQVDARSFPGGTLFFFKGLLSTAENEAALIGIVGHELSHLEHGHQLLPLKRVRLMQQRSTPGQGSRPFDPGEFFNQGLMMTRLMARPFRPEDEGQADRDGATWAYSAGYDPRELAGLFLQLQKKQPDPKVPFGDFFRTHPYNEDRHDEILKIYDELQRKDPREKLYRGRKNLLKRIPMSQQTFPE